MQWFSKLPPMVTKQRHDINVTAAMIVHPTTEESFLCGPYRIKKYKLLGFPELLL
jgi:hypothetical protein